MWQNILGNRARLRRRMALRLIARHPLIARTARWNPLLRRAGLFNLMPGQPAATAVPELEPWPADLPAEPAFAPQDTLATAASTAAPSLAPEALPAALPSTTAASTMSSLSSLAAEPGSSPQPTRSAAPSGEAAPSSTAPAETPPPAPVPARPGQQPAVSLPRRRPLIEELPSTGGVDAPPTAPEAPQAAPAPTPLASDAEAERLFAPGEGRSPEAWAARLRGDVNTPRQPSARSAASPPSVPPPPPESLVSTASAAPASMPDEARADLPAQASPAPSTPLEAEVAPPRAELTAVPPVTAASLPKVEYASSPPPVPADMNTSETLFQAPAGADRSSEGWLRRLTGGLTSPLPPSPPPAPLATPAARTVPHGSEAPIPLATPPPAAPAADLPALLQEAPAPLPETTMRFLRPLVGIDPATVRIFRGARAAETVAAARADALTMNEDVLLGAAVAGDEPTQLGLLAHELTHVARRREPPFVPPVLGGQPITQTSATPQQGSAPHAAPRPDEEPLALQVEQRVVAQARAWVARGRGLDASIPPPMPNEPDLTALTPPAQQPASEPQPPDASLAIANSDQGTWGTLPAPWEPLPAWLVSNTEPTSSPPAPGPSSAPMPSPPAVTPVVMAAETERPTADAPPMEGGAAPFEPAPTEPDLDKLAHQVYARLKRRLDAERRRLG